MKLRCLIVDDEPIARRIIEEYCSHLEGLEVTGSCGDALQAKAMVEKTPIDLIFLDVNMPVLDGIAFAKTLRSGHQVIFTTAYKEFAHEAFDLDACDYLLKPFSFERFIQAIDKAREKLAKDTKSPDQATGQFTYIRSEGKIYKIDFQDLLYAEARGNNVKIVMEGSSFAPAMTFGSFEEMLPASLFIRVHRSFIINKSKVRLIEGNRIVIGSEKIPIGSNYRAHFFREIGMK